MRMHVKYLPGCLAQRRPLINESSDLTSSDMLPSDGPCFARHGTGMMVGAVCTAAGGGGLIQPGLE